jgi:hypothetical protein
MGSQVKRKDTRRTILAAPLVATDYMGEAHGAVATHERRHGKEATPVIINDRIESCRPHYHEDGREMLAMWERIREILLKRYQ